MPVVLKPPRPPRRVAELEPLPSPESLLALGAEVEETPLWVGKWRGKGKNTLRYRLLLPEDQAVVHRGEVLQGLTLKVGPSGKAEVEERLYHEGERYARQVEASRPLWALDPKLTEEVAEAHRLLGLEEGTERAIWPFNRLLAEAAFLKHRIDLHLLAQALGAPMLMSSREYLAPFWDQERTWEGTLKRLRRGEQGGSLGEAYTLLVGGSVRLSVREGRAESKTSLAGELLAPLPLNREHPEWGEAGYQEVVGALEALKEAYTRGDRGVQAKALEEFARQRKAQELERALTSHQQTRSEGSWEWVWTQALWLAVDLLWRAEVHLPTLPLLPQGSLPGERRRALEAPRALEELAQALGVSPHALVRVARVLLGGRLGLVERAQPRLLVKG